MFKKFLTIIIHLILLFELRAVDVESEDKQFKFSSNVVEDEIKIQFEFPKNYEVEFGFFTDKKDYEDVLKLKKLSPTNDLYSSYDYYSLDGEQSEDKQNDWRMTFLNVSSAGITIKMTRKLFTNDSNHDLPLLCGKINTRFLLLEYYSPPQPQLKENEFKKKYKNPDLSVNSDMTGDQNCVLVGDVPTNHAIRLVAMPAGRYIEQMTLYGCSSRINFVSKHNLPNGRCSGIDGNILNECTNFIIQHWNKGNQRLLSFPKDSGFKIKSKYIMIQTTYGDVKEDYVDNSTFEITYHKLQQKKTVSSLHIGSYLRGSFIRMNDEEQTIKYICPSAVTQKYIKDDDLKIFKAQYLLKPHISGSISLINGKKTTEVSTQEKNRIRSNHYHDVEFSIKPKTEIVIQCTYSEKLSGAVAFPCNVILYYESKDTALSKCVSKYSQDEFMKFLSENDLSTNEIMNCWNSMNCPNIKFSAPLKQFYEADRKYSGYSL
ncbi:hypothetical protein SNEBB_009199, partial [Seison nebaliae]